ncbi:hypothetical protein HAX54_018125 [Datura stramonium]|uniref:Uncharacterized protein n=1 Tax=Datura stramonium TaxID=4076 RepID=A0ABS8ULQ2_DATST|nr:hypothetical protein [Datura stramonium]
MGREPFIVLTKTGNFSCKFPTIKLILGFIALVAIWSLWHSPAIYNTEYISSSGSSEIDQWKELLPDAEHVILNLDHVPNNITWETLYPEWIDEEEEFEVPTCPSLPKIQFLGKPRIDLIVVKLPCKKSKDWYRDVARLHLHSSSKASFHDYHRGGLEVAGWKIHTIKRIRNPKAEQDAYNEGTIAKFRSGS